MSRRQHLWLRGLAVAVIVGLQLLPHGPRNASKSVSVQPTAPAAAQVTSPELAIAEP